MTTPPLPPDYRSELEEAELTLSDTDLGLTPEGIARPPRSRWRAVAIGAAEIVILVVLFWIVMSQIDVPQLIQRLGHLSVPGALAVGLLLITHALLSAVRWRLLIVHLGGTPRLWPAIRGVLLERFVNQAVPSPVAGDGARFVEMRRTGLRSRVVALSILVDRIFALGGIFGLVTLVLPFLPFVINSQTALRSIFVIGIVPVVGLAALVGIRQRWWLWLQWHPLLHYPAGLAILLRTIVRTPGLFLSAAGLSLLVQLLPTVCFVILAHDLEVPLAAADAVVLVPVIILASVVPLSIAGWGVRESIAVVLLAEVGIGAADAVLLSVTFGILNLLTACLGGLFWIATRHGPRGLHTGGATPDPAPR